MQQPNLEPARELLKAGMRLVQLKENTKQPIGRAWNKPEHFVQKIDDRASGYGVPLAANQLVSIDPDNIVEATIGLGGCGFDLSQVMAAGVRTLSTRPGSGGRSTFVDAGGLRWLKFRTRDGIALELRAASANLQDCVPGLVYETRDGVECTQTYVGMLTHADVVELDIQLPAGFLEWWRRMSSDPEYYLEQQRLFCEALGAELVADYSTHKELPFASGFRGEFNRENDVAEMLERNGYERAGEARFLAPNATGSAGVRLIPGRDGLWNSAHGSDPLHGNFDAWMVYVLLEHDGDVKAAEEAWIDGRGGLVMFEDLEPEPVATPISMTLAPRAIKPLLPMASFDCNPKTGRAYASLENLYKAIKNNSFCGFDLVFCEFAGEMLFTPLGTNDWRPLTDGAMVEMRSNLEARGFATIGREIFRDVLSMYAEHNRVDTAIEWLGALQWDGVARVETFFSRFMGAHDNEYTRAVGLYLWSAMAGRVMVPGVAADMVPILVGAQGLGKSKGLQAMVPSSDNFIEINLSASEENLARAMRGALIGELAELQGMNTKAVEAIKAFVVRTVENWIPKFRETRVNFARRLVFCGTTNESQFLADQTGERRWLPVKVGLHGQVNRMGVAEMRTQLWAEARVLFEANGVMWSEAEKLGALEHAEFKIVDVWESEVETWLQSVDPMTGKTPNEVGGFTTADVLLAVTKMQIKDMNRSAEMRMAKILKRQGMINKQIKGPDGYRKRWY